MRLSLLFSITLLVIVAYWGPSVVASEAHSVGEKFDISELVKRHGVVFLGETHTTANHKKPALDYLSKMGTDEKFDTFAFEHSFSFNAGVFQDYLKDQEANPGSLKELFHICRISSDDPSKVITFDKFKTFSKAEPQDFLNAEDDGNYICSGHWQTYNFLPHTLAMFRKMRDLSLSDSENRLKFCPINADIIFPETLEQYMFLLSPFDEVPRKLFDEIYKAEIAEETFIEKRDDLLDPIRDFMMAINVRDCFQGRQGGVVLTGSFHTSDTTTLPTEDGKPPVTTMVETLRIMNNRGLGFGFYGINIVPLDISKDLPCRNFCKHFDDFEEYSIFLKNNPIVEPNFRLLPPSVLSAPVLNFANKQSVFSFGPVEDLYDAILLLP